MSNLIWVSDILLASILWQDFSIVEIDRNDTRRIRFAFEQNEMLKKKMKDFWGGLTMVEPIEHQNRIRQLKARIYNEA